MARLPSRGNSGVGAGDESPRRTRRRANLRPRSEQKLITLDDGSALILTVANYYNGSGKSILDEGVVPTKLCAPRL